jgi:hypothetical protein
LFALGFAAVTVVACVLLGRRFTHTSWPLQRAHMSLLGGAIALYFASVWAQLMMAIKVDQVG